MSRHLLSIVGQSNEGQSAVGAQDRVTGLGSPTADISGGSMWPALSQEVAKRGRWLSIERTAVGSTSLVEQWVGRVRSWSSGQVYGMGGYALHGGTVYKKTSAGIQASTTAPAVGTGADTITWASARSATAADVDGATYQADNALYDPNGYIAAALTAITLKPGYSSTGVLISIGQGDHSISSTRTQYAQALQTVAEQFSAKEHTVWMGMTCYMAGDPAREATFQSVLLPGLADALLATAGNPRVKRGANLRTELGVLPIVADQTSLGVQADELHMNAYTLRLAAKRWDAALAAGGW